MKSIDKAKTYDMIRTRYRSVAKFAAAKGTSTVMVYMVVTGQRGGKRKKAPEAERLREIMAAEGLFVYGEAV